MKTRDELANEIIEKMRSWGLSPVQMLEVLRMTRGRLEGRQECGACGKKLTHSESLGGWCSEACLDASVGFEYREKKTSEYFLSKE